MFGLFNRNKAEKRELAELQAAGAPRSADPFTRRRHASLVHLLHGSEAALPYMDSIAADFPGSWKMAFNAATIRLMIGDPAGVAQLEAVAKARPGLAVQAYQMALQFVDQCADAEEIGRIRPEFSAAFDRHQAAVAEGSFLDPGGPVEPHRYSSDDLAFIHAELQGSRGLEQLLAGSRQLADGAHQQLLVADFAPSADVSALVPTLHSIADHFGEYLLVPLDAEHEWLAAQLRALPDSRIYP